MWLFRIPRLGVVAYAVVNIALIAAGARASLAEAYRCTSAIEKLAHSKDPSVRQTIVSLLEQMQPRKSMLGCAEWLLYQGSLRSDPSLERVAQVAYVKALHAGLQRSEKMASVNQDEPALLRAATAFEDPHFVIERFSRLSRAQTGTARRSITRQLGASISYYLNAQHRLGRSSGTALTIASLKEPSLSNAEKALVIATSSAQLLANGAIALALGGYREAIELAPEDPSLIPAYYWLALAETHVEGRGRMLEYLERVSRLAEVGEMHWYQELYLRSLLLLKEMKYISEFPATLVSRHNLEFEALRLEQNLALLRSSLSGSLAANGATL